MTHVSVTEAKAQLTDLVRRAQAGEDVVLTRHGQEVVRLSPVKTRQTPVERRRIIQQIQESAHGKIPQDFDAARSQDYLYDEDGLPT